MPTKTKAPPLVFAASQPIIPKRKFNRSCKQTPFTLATRKALNRFDEWNEQKRIFLTPYGNDYFELLEIICYAVHLGERINKPKKVVVNSEMLDFVI